MSIAYIGLGANLGDRLVNLRHARTALAAMPGLVLEGSSKLYETEPVGGPEGQPAFFNAVLKFSSQLEPPPLLQACLELERACGRKRDIHWGPRTLDLDLLLFGDRVGRTLDLELPHPRLTERGFVLAPLLDLAAEQGIPGTGRTVRYFYQQGAPWPGVTCRGDW